MSLTELVEAMIELYDFHARYATNQLHVSCAQVDSPSRRQYTHMFQKWRLTKNTSANVMRAALRKSLESSRRKDFQHGDIHITAGKMQRFQARNPNSNRSAESAESRSPVIHSKQMLTKKAHLRA